MRKFPGRDGIPKFIKYAILKQYYFFSKRLNNQVLFAGMQSLVFFVYRYQNFPFPNRLRLSGLRAIALSFGLPFFGLPSSHTTSTSTPFSLHLSMSFSGASLSVMMVSTLSRPQMRLKPFLPNLVESASTMTLCDASIII